MANFNSTQAAEKAAGKKLDGAINGAPLKTFRCEVPLTGQAIGDTINLFTLPRGYRFAHGVLVASVGLGTATLAVGTAANPGKYRAAAVMNSADTPTLFGTQAAAAEAEGAEKDVIATVGTAALPAAGTLTVFIFASERG